MESQKRRIDLSKIDTSKAEKTWYSLIEVPKGSITYEHYLVDKIYPDICFCTGERNYYIDRNHELCLCVHYNRRVPGEYVFIPDYQFFVTKKRMCIDIYWNLGNISDESMIIQKYNDLESAKDSLFYEDFADMKQQIDERIKWKKEQQYDPFESEEGSSFKYLRDENGNYKYEVYEFASQKDKEFVQVYWNNISNNWELLSTTKTPISDLAKYLKDFEYLDNSILHLRHFVPFEEIKKNPDSKYHEVFEKAVLRKKLWEDAVSLWASNFKKK